jgi:hypothetical protein
MFSGKMLGVMRTRLTKQKAEAFGGWRMRAAVGHVRDHERSGKDREFRRGDGASETAASAVLGRTHRKKRDVCATRPVSSTAGPDSRTSVASLITFLRFPSSSFFWKIWNSPKYSASIPRSQLPRRDIRRLPNARVKRGLAKLITVA